MSDRQASSAAQDRPNDPMTQSLYHQDLPGLARPAALGASDLNHREGQSAAAPSLRLAYADPPYPGQAKRHYGKKGDPYQGTIAEVDHAELLKRLQEYDGWALSTSMPALRDILQLAPASAVVAVWYITNSEPPGSRSFLHWYSWEPVIVSPARARKDVRNVLTTPALTGFLGATMTGEKPPAFCEWLFAMLGAEQGDSLDDLFPGSGAVGRAWDTFRSQLRLPTATVGETEGFPNRGMIRARNSRLRRKREREYRDEATA